MALLRWLLLLGNLFILAQARADADHCAVCGVELYGKLYIITDKVTEEKKRICQACANLPTDCFICGLPVKTNFTTLPDGRFLCERDAQTAVLDDAVAERLVFQVKSGLDSTFSRFLNFPDTNVTTKVVDRVNLLELFKFPGNDYNCPNVLGYIQSRTNGGKVRYVISLMGGLLEPQFKAVIAHEYAHAWVFENVPAARLKDIGQAAHEGFCELVAYLLMGAQNEGDQQKMILHNKYTRGQIDLFVEAEQRFGLNDVVEWMKYGTDRLLSKEDLNRIHNIEVPGSQPAVSNTVKLYPPRLAVRPTQLMLKGIVWSKGQPLALINDQTFALQEEHRVHLGETNELIRCLAIEKDSVRVRIVNTGKEQELSLP